MTTTTELIAECERILAQYPETHPDHAKIKQQIERLKHTTRTVPTTRTHEPTP